MLEAFGEFEYVFVELGISDMGLMLKGSDVLSHLEGTSRYYW